MRTLSVIGLVVLAACTQPASQQSNGRAGRVSEIRQDLDGTAAMVARLAFLADSTEANPIINAHVNRARVARMLENGPPPDPQQQLYWRIALGTERLRAGDNEGAIEDFEAVLGSSDGEVAAMANPNSAARTGSAPLGTPTLSPKDRLAVLDLLAISYLRLGEQENCIDSPGADRCIWPIVKDGVHRYPRGSRGAIDRYEQLLKEDPEDLNSLWLLNVAYMTLGAWPEGVPTRWRLPRSAAEGEGAFPRFPDRAAAVGVDTEGLSGGLVMEDLNGDGLLDLLASSWGLRDPLRLFINRGDGHFRDATPGSGLEGLTSGLNMIHADYDNDGDQDVFVLRGSWLDYGYPNSLLRNDGDGHFTDITVAAGLGQEHPTHSAAFADYNGDGLLDLFVGNESHAGSGYRPSQLFRNRGDGTFEDVTAAGGPEVVGWVKGVAWGDVNGDDRPDLYVSLFEEPNQLHLNEGPGPDGTWRFREVAREAGVHEPIDSFPTWFWDYDNDGHLDLFVSGWRASAGDVAAEYMGQPFRAERPRLYRNRGDGTFEDRAVEAGLDKVLFSMGANFGDLNGDGWLDFYVGTGDPDFRAQMPNRMFLGDGVGGFREVTAQGGFGHLQKGHAAAFGDLDWDGDQDVYTVMGGAFEGDVFRNVLFENPLTVPGWMSLRLQGESGSRDAIGARIRGVAPDGRRLFRTVGTGGSFGSSSMNVYLGLGEAMWLDTLEVTWPVSGAIELFTRVAGARAYTLAEGSGQLMDVTRAPFRLATESDHLHP